MKQIELVGLKYLNNTVMVVFHICHVQNRCVMPPKQSGETVNREKIKYNEE